jgi:hypothetical protein
LQDRLSLLDGAAVYDYPLLFATACYDVDSRSYYYDTVAILPSGLSGTLLRHSIVDL